MFAGCSIQMRLPWVGPMSHFAAPREPARLPAATRAREAMARPSIWVVDDDVSVGRALRRMVRALDADCVLCASGDAMLELLGTARPTFVLLDIHMPHQTGVEALREMRARGIDVPAVMMTGVEREGTRDACLAAGALDLLAKPVDADAITALLARIAGPQGQG